MGWDHSDQHRYALHLEANGRFRWTGPVLPGRVFTFSDDHAAGKDCPLWSAGPNLTLVVPRGFLFR